jgi:uncharacterized protein YfaA (DUF2138 family)
MKLAVVVAACALVLLPGVVSAQVVGADEAEQKLSKLSVSAHPAECARLRRQIDHFYGMMERAHAFENDLWEQRLANHLELLLAMQQARCPNDVRIDETGEAFKQFLKLAAKAAITYFTFGAGGF